MKLNFRFKFLLLVAIMVLCFAPTIDAQVIQPVAHYIASFTPEHVFTGVASLAVLPLAVYVKDNCTIPLPELAELTNKYGKIKILSVVIEAPTYDENGELIDKGEFYSFACKRPDQGTVRLMMDYAKKGDTEKYIQCFIKNIVVGGDKDVLDNDGIVYLGLSQQVDNFLKPYESFLSKA